MNIILAVMVGVMFFVGTFYGSYKTVKRVIQFNANDKTKNVSLEEIREFLTKINSFRS